MIVRLFICFFFSSMVLSIESKEELCPWTNFTSGERKMDMYNIEDSICCQHGIQPKFDIHSQEQRCCANTTYYVQWQICCNRTVFQKLSDEGFTRKCCGSTVYDEREGEKICCRGNVFPNSDGSKSCCGSSLMDSTRMCCSNDDTGQHTAVIRTPDTECCLSTPYNARTHHCYLDNTVLPQNIEMCGGRQYNLSEHICCSNQTLYPMTAGMQNRTVGCCGTHLVNRTTQRCCTISSPFFVAPIERYCCGNSHYDIDKQRCCQNKVLDARPGENCCGSSLFNTTTQGCCGGKPYDRSIDKCCEEGNQQSIVSKQYTCCGVTGMDSSTQVCCTAFTDTSFTVTKTHPDQDACCVNHTQRTGQPYGRTMSRCHRGKVIPNRGSNNCGTSLYDSDRDQCCGGSTVHRNAKHDGKKCCHPGTAVYHDAYQSCCDGVVFNNTDKESCGYKSPRPRIDLRSDVYSICSICRWERGDFLTSLIDGLFNPCQSNALKLHITYVRTTRHRRKYLLRTTLEAEVRKDVADPKNKTLRGESKTLILPCYCKTLRNLGEIVLVTRIPTEKRTMYLGDSDWIMPFYPRIERIVRHESQRCKFRKAKDLQDVKEYLDYKIRKLSAH